MFNIRRVDLNLLPVFEAVYEEQSLSRAAARLAMTQSAVSHAVTRLRALFNDELFVRQPRGVRPTPTAEVVYARIRSAGDLIHHNARLRYPSGGCVMHGHAGHGG